ncbi:SpoIIE family protein phosphatase [Streptomyces uncialis]|uniref:Uncharacterized protein n=1 Tax=Streptomyces uncialis TaxID=1048205 RepID=A0A1Q4V983_9ACTN|nr:SpoIIE family protein phosphatase [Streptomyces uncialis]OKH94403.1 hypothetical protein AB852_08820 [Streptomyces uncialis]
MGDVRGKGITAIETVPIVLGAFREASHDERTLPEVAARLEKTLDRDRADRNGGHDLELRLTGRRFPTPARLLSTLVDDVQRFSGGLTATTWPSSPPTSRCPARHAEAVASADRGRLRVVDVAGPYEVPAPAVLLPDGRLLEGTTLISRRRPAPRTVV